MTTEGKKINPDTIQQCVQCLQQYKEENNGDNSCKFHLRSVWSGRYSCCNKRSNEPGCNNNRHRAQHHNEYKYGEFLKLVSSILNYTNTRTEWASIESHDLEKNIKLNATIGFVLPKSPHWRNHLYIKLNSYWNFSTFPIDYIKNFNKGKTYSDRVLIKEFIDPDTKGVIKAEWALNKDNNNIYGVYLSIKTQTSKNIECILIKFSITGNDKLVFDVKEQISKGGFTEYKPSKLYHDLIDNTNVGIIKFEGAEFEQTYDPKQVEKQRKNIKTKCYGSMINDLIITQKQFTCNDRFSYSGDRLFLEIQFMNKCEKKDFVFIEVSGVYQLYGDKNWSDLNNNNSVLILKKYKKESSYYLNEIESMPFNVSKGRGNSELVKLEIFLPFEFEQQPKPASSWFQRSFLARHRPINFKFKFKDIDQNNIIFQTQFITDLYGYNDSKETVFSMPIQDAITFDYTKCYIELDKIEKRNSNCTINDDEKKKK
eukprot:117940_1